MGFSSPSQPPLLPSSQPPERLRFQEREPRSDTRKVTSRAEKYQLLWFALILGVFGVLFLGAVLLSWLLGR